MPESANIFSVSSAHRRGRAEIYPREADWYKRKFHTSRLCGINNITMLRGTLPTSLEEISSSFSTP